MPSQAYFESDGQGDWYECIVATSPGESPGTNPEKWRRLDLPAIFEDAVAQLAIAHLYIAEGQSDKARAQRAAGIDAKEQTAFLFVDRGDYHPAEVFTR